jgi:hypothetical protein
MNPYALLLVCYIKEVLADNDLWLRNTCHDALPIGHEAGKKGRGEKRREKRGKKKEKKT